MFLSHGLIDMPHSFVGAYVTSGNITLQFNAEHVFILFGVNNYYFNYVTPVNANAGNQLPCVISDELPVNIGN